MCVLGPKFQSIYMVRTNAMWGTLVFKLFGKGVAAEKEILISFSHMKSVLEVRLISLYRIMQ